MAAESLMMGGAALGGLVIFLFILLWIMIVGGSVFLTVIWILMIIDVAQRKFKESNDKIVWILVVILTSWIGAIIYYFVIKKPNKH